MKLVYIVGPFRAATGWEIELNIRRAEALALEVWKLGAAAVCPHMNTRHFHGVLPDEVWLNGYLEIMSRCDAVIIVDGWRNSAGSRAEVQLAIDLNLPIFHESEMLQRWLQLQ